ncbi:hypothetical protein QMZ64_21485 [Bacillus sp. LB7]|uniref:hypothetical protein n=1 Tax=Bacillus TaxID=1386 RepID=UPI0026499896|nr:hypothetical protein [Bacillus sp. LB7]MDN5389966.1 hypothetical protein [Bacillus sp. LB7]
MRKKWPASCFLFFLLCLLFFWLPGIEKAAAATYSPYDINEKGINSATQGNRAASFTSGKKLVYDVYDGKNGKEGWKVVNRDYGKGKQPYLEFTGWSAIVGYTHHNKNNQDTYFYLTNNKNEKKIYKAEQLNLSASKDIEYNRKSETGKINNPCPSKAFNKNNDECNLYYDYVGFKAHIPLNDLFKDGTVDQHWNIQIVKRVENHYIYDDLRVPFEFSGLSYSKGELQLTSGLDAVNLRMGYGGVARRDYPRQSGYSGGRYFTKGDTYRARSSDQESTVVWYGVKTPEEKNKTRWAASLYWIFGGERALLKYKVTTVDVTIVHKDKNTGKILRTDKTKGTVGDSFNYAPESKGTFKDENGAPYVPVSKAITGKVTNKGVNITFEYEIPSQTISVIHKDKDTGKVLRTDKTSQKVGTSYAKSPEKRGFFTDQNNRPYVPVSESVSGKMPDQNVTITFYYRLSVPKPDTGGEISGGKDGDGALEGEVSWNLYKEKNGKASLLRFDNRLSIKGKHFEVKNVSKSIKTSLLPTEKIQSTDNLMIEKQNPTKWKSKTVEYSLVYEYTNFYKDVYVPKEYLGDDVFVWEKVGQVADWSKSKKTDKKIKLKIEHSYHDRLVFSDDSKTEKSFITGEQSDVKGQVSKDKEFVSSSTNNKLVTLKTQTWLSFLQKDFRPQYSVSSDKESKKSSPVVYGNLTAFYYPVDIDDSLKQRFANQTKDNLSKYAIPLDLIEKKAANDATPFLFRASDDFYLTKKTGFVDAVKPNIKDPEQQIKNDYEKLLSVPYDDSILSKNHGLTDKELQESGGGYYMSIDSSSSLKPGEEYIDWLVVNNLGLNDISIQIPQKYKFDHYLLGAAADDPVINEQNETPISISDDKYTNSVTVNDDQRKTILNEKSVKERKDLLYGFKSIDSDLVLNSLRKAGINP